MPVHSYPMPALAWRLALACTLLRVGADAQNTCSVCESETTGAAEGEASTAMGGGRASGPFSFAAGFETEARGGHSTAMGEGARANGDWSTAFGLQTRCSGRAATCFGSGTYGTGRYAVAMGLGMFATEDESLAVSGNVFADNLNIRIDERLVSNITAVADTSALLSEVRELQLVEYSPSRNVCAHKGRSAAACASAGMREVGLLGRQVEAAIPAAVNSGSSLRLSDAALERPAALTAAAKTDNAAARKAEQEAPALEMVHGAKSLDVGAMLARLVGSVQALDKRLAGEAKLNAEQAEQIKAQALLIQRQQEQIRALGALI